MAVGGKPDIFVDHSRTGGRPVLLMFESDLARDESHHAAFGMNVFTAALEAAIRAVRIDRPLLVTLYR